MAAPKLQVSAPVFNKLSKSDKLPERLLMGPGPANFFPGVTEALAGPLFAPFDDETMLVMEDIRKGIQYLFQTKSRLTFAFSGAGMAAMECCITNLVSPGEVLLIMRRGEWDLRAADIGRRHGAIVKEVSTELGTTFTLEQIENAVKEHRPAVLFLTHGDSSTGTVQQIEGVGEICRRYDTLLLVDTVVSIASIPFMMDAWQVDAVYAGGQKGISAPAGISPISYNDRAERKILGLEKSSIWYYDVKLIANQWNCFGDTRSYHHTSCSPLLFALRAALNYIIEEGLHNIWERHRIAVQHLYAGLEKLDLEYFVPNPNDRLLTVTSLIFPKDFKYPEVVRHLREKYGIVTNPGLGPSKDKCLRVGCMGQNARIESIDRLLNGLSGTLVDLKKSKY